ncbi:cation channel sperm-associated protein 1 [Sorex fumeus]|uniref:cation channel sperm-associated protein 1 n=1 Tax=Sorex fumeus TaxID=62283 RepID=UPI0024AE6326|nr:cation channel sperm-associated protein 1 [Sorex fumeus]
MDPPPGPRNAAADENNPNLLSVVQQRRPSSPFRLDRPRILHHTPASSYYESYSTETTSRDGSQQIKPSQTSPPARRTPRHSVVHYSASVRGPPSEENLRQPQGDRLHRPSPLFAARSHKRQSLRDTAADTDDPQESHMDQQQRPEAARNVDVPYSFKRRNRHTLDSVPSQVTINPFQEKKPESYHSLSHSSSHVSSSLGKVHPGSSESSSDEGKREKPPRLRVPNTSRTRPRWRVLQLCSWLCEELSKLYKGFQNIIGNLTSSQAFEAFIALIIYINIIVLVAQTFAIVEVRGEWYFIALDTVFLCIYVIEAALKNIALGYSYFSDNWNKLDFFIMSLALLDFVLIQHNYFSVSRQIYSQNFFRIFKVLKSLRALRAMRVMWKLSFLRTLQKVTETLNRSLPSITAILILMFTCLFLFSALLRALFRYSDPKHFQNLFTTVFTLFTLLTLDDWSLIYLHNLENGAWYIIPILMIYIIIQYFIFLNLVIAVLVDNFQMALLKGQEQEKEEAVLQLEDLVMEVTKAESSEMKDLDQRQQAMEKSFGAMTEK